MTKYVEKTYWKKRIDLKEKVKRLEGDVVVVHLTSWSVDNFTFNIKNYQVLLAYTSQDECVVDFGCTHHMAKDVSLFSSLDIL